MKAIVRSVLMIFIIVAGGHAAYACSCFRISLRQEFLDTKVVFAGEVVEIEEDKSYVPESESARNFIGEKRYLVKFRISRKYKGAEGDEAVLLSFQGQGMCPGVTFVKGEKYLVFADPRDQRLFSGGCSSTGKLSERGKEYRKLNGFSPRAKK